MRRTIPITPKEHLNYESESRNRKAGRLEWASEISTSDSFPKRAGAAQGIGVLALTLLAAVSLSGCVAQDGKAWDPLPSNTPEATPSPEAEQPEPTGLPAVRDVVERCGWELRSWLPPSPTSWAR